MRQVTWLIGRGIAESCGLSWQVPEEWYDERRRGELSREALVERIRHALHKEQHECLARGGIDTSAIDRLARQLPEFHGFVTTNWDTILDVALAPYGRRVWHLNGSIADHGDILTELDSREGRDHSLARNPGFKALLGAQTCILAGLSLKSRLDRELVERLGAEQAWMPAGERWVVVNQDPGELRFTTDAIDKRLPRSTVIPVDVRFEEWVAAGLPGLDTIE